MNPGILRSAKLCLAPAKLRFAPANRRFALRGTRTAARRFGLPLLGAAALLVAGCGRATDLSPPAIVYGEHECEHCKMIISEQRHAAALAVREGRNVSRWAFDDVGCLLDWLGEHPPAGEWTPYVHDLTTGEWLDARTARFVQSERLETPMASQLAASASQEGARRLLEQYPGTIVSFNDLLQARMRRGTSHRVAVRPRRSPLRRTRRGADR
jgi:copper chaperone NosL